MEFRAKQTFLCLSVLFLHVAADQHAPEVHTKLGSVRGMQVSVKGTENKVDAFLGIPFAKPPVGPALRLAAPQPVEGWEGVRDGTQQPPMCVQTKQFLYDMLENIGGLLIEFPDISEDCLYLNIYSPANRAPNAKLPVMVWIHGGSFVVGSASMYDGSALAAYQDVVVVVIQYRLGLLGFLSTGDEHMSGNFGLLDQVQALRWTQEHIHNFGGNPDLVTIFGESAGGVSVSLLLLSPLSNGLFHHAIAESGTAAMDLLLDNNPLPAAQIVANISGCSLENTQTIADCVKNLDMNTIVDLVKNERLRFPVNVDGHLLTKPVDKLFQKNELLTVPFMTGVNDDEGGWLLAHFFAPPNWTEGIDREQLVSAISIFTSDATLADMVVDEYAGDGEDRVKNRDAFTEMLGDTLFIITAIKTANSHRDAGAPVYLYEYRHVPKLLQAKRPSFVGSDHGDEIFTVFGYCFVNSQVKLTDECPEEDMQLSRTVMSYWGNFARTGSPNGHGLAHWPKYGADEHYLKIDAKEQVVGQSLKKDRFIFFTQTLPEKMKQHKMKHSPEVHTKLGSLRGTHVSVKGKETGVDAFLGIPFAKPPVGPALRLAAPQPVEGWEGVRDATQQPPICVQNKQWIHDLLEKFGAMAMEVPDISEDCLYLNIYSPANRAPNAKLPVMVWIHGGGFAMGSASSYDGSALAAYQDVVVVLIQYRLGLLGFLSTGDEHMSGNFGLLDQVQALRWVQEHIHNFGGNPDLVTIFGESAGGMSVSLLLLSPLSDGLFHHAIAESGTAAMDVFMNNNPLVVAQMVANVSGCSLDSTETIADCMKNLEFDTIEAFTKDPTIQFPLNVDGHFLTKPVGELFQKHELLTLPFMTGVNDDEGGWLLADFFAPPNWTEGMDREDIVRMVSMFNHDPVLTDLMVNEYIGNGEDRMKNRNGFTEILGDIIFNIPAIKAANAHRDAGAPVYLYEYRHAPKLLQAKRPSSVGSDHGDEILTVLGLCFTTSHVTVSDECSEEDIQLSRTMMSYWGNFARTGSPNWDGLAHWPKYGADEKYLEIHAKEQVVRQSLKKDRFIFMSQTLPEKAKEHKAKHSPEVHTKLGSLRGTHVSVKGKETGVDAFLGIPFAKPPVGPALRLAAPQPVEGWEGVRDATQQPRMCVQNKQFAHDLLEKLHFAMLMEIPDISEDCLYLNIYTPANRAPNAKLPVMVWIHGGGFSMGSASMFDGSVLAAYQDVVVVAIQYRLGLLGFLSTGDEHISGNFGLLDQVQALRWTQEHIHNFGGNPDLVTIFGESAGGVSVSLLLLSPLSDGLFHHAIAESGTAAMDLLINNHPLPVTQMVANVSGCSLENTETIADCMKNLDINTIEAFTKDEKLQFPINVDGHFLAKPVSELFQKHEFLTVPFLTGVNDDEGGWLLADFFAPPSWTEGMDREQVVSLISTFYPDPILTDLVVEEYIGKGEDRVKNRDGFTEILGDMIFTISAIKAANAHRDAGVSVYLYQYRHAPKILQEKRPSFVGSDHADELFAVLGFCFTTSFVKLSDECTEEELQLSRTMMSYWGNFARTGSPNGHGLVHWPKYGADEKYLEIHAKEQVVGESLKKDRFIFMSQTLPEKIKEQKVKEHSEL